MNILQQRLHINRYFFRLIIAGLLIAFFVVQFFWAGRLFARIWNFPEIRYDIDVQPSSEGNINRAELSVANLGFGTAENVLIHINTGGSRIQGYQIDSQELYEIKSIDLGQGIVNIWLDRLASDAQVRIDLEVENLLPDGIELSATSDQGSGVHAEEKTFSDQAIEYVGSVTIFLHKSRAFLLS